MRTICLTGLGLLCVSLMAVQGAEGDAISSQSAEARRVAAEIDRLIAEKWDSSGVTPAPLAEDAEFFRRVHLDLTGRIPRAAEVRDFLENPSPDKRQQEVDQLLATPLFVIHHTNLWRAAIIPEAASDQNIRFQLPGFEAWLRSRVAENRNFAEICEELLTLPLTNESAQLFQQPNSPTPVAFYTAKEFKIEALTAATSRLFLGVRIDCAQCHDHPFDKWKQPQFWSLAALFSDVPAVNVETGQTELRSSDGRSIKIPDKDIVVEAGFLDGSKPDWSTAESGRIRLARWITSRENPYFAKAAVNRMWSYHFGLGLVEPMDDFSEQNPPSHPELMELLAKEFQDHNFDTTFISRAITYSQTYQRTSRQTHDSQADQRVFARMPVRGLTPEQIFDSLAQATGYRQPFDPEQPLNFNNDQTRQEFIATFADDSESPTQRATTILQAFALMNGDFVGRATNLTESRTLAAALDAPFLDVDGKVEALYLTTLSRLPTEAERDYCRNYISGGGPRQDPQAACADIFWALLNSTEFLLNH